MRRTEPRFGARGGDVSPLDWEAGLARDYAFSQLIRSGDVAQVQQRIQDEERDVNAVGLDGALPLCVAVSTQDQGMINALLQAGASPNHADEQGDTPLIKAVTIGNLVLVRTLLDAGADVNQATPTGEAPIHIAARKPDPTVLQMLLDTPDIHANQADENQETALHCAAARAHVANAGLLLKAGADVGRVNGCGYTPLDLALDNYANPAVAVEPPTRKLDMVQVLLTHGGRTAPRTSASGEAVLPDKEVVQGSEMVLASVLEYVQAIKRQAEQLIQLIEQKESTV
jgi:ankyrin repeat protein